MTKRRLLLHIGPPKHGSSAIQDMLSTNSDLLKLQGFVFPADSWYLAESFKSRGYQRYREIFAEQYGINSEPFTVIVSAENLFGCNIDEVTDFFGQHFDEVRAIWYLRRQDRLATSHFMQQFKFLNYKTECFSTRIDYVKRSREWAKKLGRENVVVRPFDKKSWVDTCLLKDFLHHAGVNGNNFSLKQFSNRSMTTLAKDCMSIIQSVLHPYKVSNDGLNLPRKRLIKFREFVERTFATDIPFSPSLDQAKCYYSQFIDANNSFVREFELDWQFDHDDFSMYEEAPRHMPVEEIRSHFDSVLVEFQKQYFSDSDWATIDAISGDTEPLHAEILLLLCGGDESLDDKRFLINLLINAKRHYLQIYERPKQDVFVRRFLGSLRRLRKSLSAN